MSNLGRRASVNGDEEWQLRLKEAKGSAVPRVKMAAEISLSSHPGCVLVRGAMTLAQRFLLSLGPWKPSEPAQKFSTRILCAIFPLPS